MNGFSELLKIRERVGSERAETERESRDQPRGDQRGSPLVCSLVLFI